MVRTKINIPTYDHLEALSMISDNKDKNFNDAVNVINGILSKYGKKDIFSKGVSCLLTDENVNIINTSLTELNPVFAESNYTINLVFEDLIDDYKQTTTDVYLVIKGIVPK